jgi:hypothetical protein
MNIFGTTMDIPNQLKLLLSSFPSAKIPFSSWINAFHLNHLSLLWEKVRCCGSVDVSLLDIALAFLGWKARW